MNSETIGIGPGNVTAVVLAGGMGTRLRTVIPDLPKVMARVNGQPFLGHLLDQLHYSGFREVILCTGYRAETIRAFFGENYRALKILYSHETEPLGTAGALRKALPLIGGKTFMAMNGDSYINTDLASYLDWFSGKSNSEAALLLTRVNDTSRYGAVDVDELGYVIRFLEKGAARSAGWINAGVYLLQKPLLAAIPLDRAFSLELDFLPSLIGKGLCSFQSQGEFIDIGTPESLAQAGGFFSKLRRKQLVRQDA